MARREVEVTVDVGGARQGDPDPVLLEVRGESVRMSPETVWELAEYLRAAADIAHQLHPDTQPPGVTPDEPFHEVP